ncbi:MAG: hypothetical protein QOK12_1322 [Mycobacterium sp.]|nr:hypothetical protein [Mycobacterium sp.]
MRASVAIAIVGLTLPVASGASAQAAGAKHVRTSNVAVHLGRHRCAKTAVNGINNRGVVLGTSYCGRAKAFIKTPKGKTRTYTLPKSDARYTYGSNIASDGTLALDGSRTKKGQSIGYLVSPHGRVTAVQDPSAGSFSTIVSSVNRHGAAVGQYCLNHKCTRSMPFIYRGGNFKTFTLHRRGALLPSLSVITDSGAVGGSFYQRPGYSRAFVKRGHHIHVYDAPQGGRKLGEGTYLSGAGSHGTLCGNVQRRHQHMKGFVVKHGHEYVVDLHPKHRAAGTGILTCNSHAEFGGTAIKPGTRSGEGFIGRVG